MSISQHQKPIETGLGPVPEPAEILANIDLGGKTALVTGGYSGIGLETVRALAEAGAHVHVPARDVARAQKALDGIIEPSHVDFMDLSDLASVAAYGDALAARHGTIDIAILNAGVMACPLARTAQGVEWQIGVNHLGHFALLKKILPALRAAQGARLVTLSSIGHRMGGIEFDDMNYDSRDYHKWAAYGQAKSAQALMAVELDRREKDNGIRSFAVHPGGIFTPLQRHLPNEEMVMLGWTNEDGSPSELAAAGFKTTKTGAGTSLWAATAPKLDGLGGVYCEDCNIAAPVPDDDGGYNGVRSWAIDSDIATRLWDETEAWLARL